MFDNQMPNNGMPQTPKLPQYQPQLQQKPQGQLPGQATQQPQQLPGMPQQSFAHGGHATGDDKHFILGHFNKAELPMLDTWQGKASYIPGTKIRHYKGLEKRFVGDHIFSDTLNKHVDGHMRTGRLQELKEQAAHLKKLGRHGDTEVALIGPHTRRFLDHCTGGDVNPHDGGHPEYFNLGDVLGGIGGAISPYVKSAGNWIGNKLGAGDIGSAVTDFGSKAYDNFIKPAGNFVGQFAKPIGNAIGGAFGDPKLGDTIDSVGDAASNYFNPDQQQEAGATGSPVEGPPTQMQDRVNQANAFIRSPVGQGLGAGAKKAFETYGNYGGGAATPEEQEQGFMGPQRASPGTRGREAARQGAGAGLEEYGRQTPGSFGGMAHGAGYGIRNNLSPREIAGKTGQGAWMGSQGQSGVADNLMSRFGGHPSQAPQQRPPVRRPQATNYGNLGDLYD